MATTTTLDLADKIAMYVGGGLVVLGVVVLGIINVLAGAESPLYAYEVTQNGEPTTGHALAPGMAPEGAEIIHSPLFDPNLRAYIIALGLIIFGLYAVYRLFVHSTEDSLERAGTPSND
ncbi:MAG: hypothetical protein ABEJ73_01000 [Haloplanus sp.]